MAFHVSESLVYFFTIKKIGYKATARIIPPNKAERKGRRITKHQPMVRNNNIRRMEISIDLLMNGVSSDSMFIIFQRHEDSKIKYNLGSNINQDQIKAIIGVKASLSIFYNLYNTKNQPIRGFLCQRLNFYLLIRNIEFLYLILFYSPIYFHKEK